MSASVTYTAVILAPYCVITEEVTLEMHGGLLFDQVNDRFRTHLDSWYQQGTEIKSIRVVEPVETTPRNRRKAQSMLDVQKQLAGLVQDTRDLHASARRNGPAEGLAHEWELDMSGYRALVKEMREVQKHLSAFMGD